MLRCLHFILLLFAFAAVPARAATVRLVADEWYPYNGQPGAEREGYLIDLARRVALDNGDRVDYQTMDWQGAVETTRRGEADCAVGATPRDGAGLNFGPETFGRSISTFFVLRDSRWHFDGARDLTRARLAIIAGYDYGATLADYLKLARPAHLTVIEGSRRGLHRAVSLLVAHRVDVVVDDQEVARATIAELGLQDRVQPAGRLPETLDIYLACSPRSAEGKRFLAALNRGVRRLRDSGELARIMARYGMKDWIAP